ncbi:hypothetical protein [Pseudofrankia inefficax]|uniref:Uncharacterized protein n=1 Tax=Pseudofrankia inefficax (strain DSM 45817 / CECT 9037 / DDB 130130 / EuI1c) TaxID=298654 RepID=E3J7K1_PSEI1|nr:hypothetical protein [Pseudofrankia inefficax]ADP79610.1 hypothetical protein FraEuI1c_1548 [Pseudofrankia inefficax]
MSDAGVNRSGDQVELSEERAELLPDRTTLAAIGTNRYGFTPTNAVVDSPTSSNFPISSPASNNAVVNSVSQPQVSGGFMPVVITFMPTFNFIVQGSSPESLGVGHHAGDGLADGTAGKDVPAAGSSADGGQWMDFLRRWFGM